MSVLELSAVTRAYRPQQPPAIDAVSLTVARGEILALLGPSGSGKSTLLRLIAGFEKPDAGAVVIDGRVVATASSSIPPERRGVGIVFQDYALFPHLTVEANVAFGLHGLPRARRPLARAAEAASLVDRSPHSAITASRSSRSCSAQSGWSSMQRRSLRPRRSRRDPARVGRFVPASPRTAASS